MIMGIRFTITRKLNQSYITLINEVQLKTMNIAGCEVYV